VPTWVTQPSGPVLERLEWLTDVIPAFDGSEQRRSLRAGPRRFLEFPFVASGAARRTLENALHSGQAVTWSLPVWMDAAPLQTTVSASATSLAVDTTTRDFGAGRDIILYRDEARFEVCTIDSLTSSSITLDAGTASGWPAGETLVIPVRPAVLPDTLALARFTGSDATGTVRFEIVGPNDWTAETPGTTYRSHPVLTQAPNWTEDPEHSIARAIDRVDGRIGGFFLDAQAAGPQRLQSHRWLLDGRAAIDAYRQWLHARRGRLAAFWLPTWAIDLVPVATIGSSDTTIDVAHCSYTASVAQAIGRRDIRIETAAGAVLYRRITGSTEVSSTVERLTISSALGSTLAPADVVAISFMSLARLEADAAEIQWSTSDLAEATVMTRAALNDL